MPWTMNVNPTGSVILSALLAAIPIFFLFWALAIKQMKGHYAAAIATVLAVGIAVIGYHMPAKYALLSTIYGSLFGLFPVCWIVITALFIYNMSVETGHFEVIKNTLASISDDRRMQALLIAFAFGAFIEGAAGFGTPVAITTAMLVGLGFNPLYACGICLLANTAPVAFGAIGIPIVVAGQVSGVPEMAISQLVGRTLPLLSVFIPLYVCILMSGWKRGLEVWPACFVTGGSFAIVQFLTSNYLGPLLPDILSSIASIICTVVFLRFWHPKQSWRFPEEPASKGKEPLRFTAGQIYRAWAPFVILSLFVVAWGIKPVGNALNEIFLFKFAIPGLDAMVIDHVGQAKAAVYKFNFLSATGTAILFAWFCSIPVMGASLSTALRVAGNTIRTLAWPIFTVATILGFAYIMNFSGMAIALGNAFAKTGHMFPIFSAFLGWLGVFMTGSDTSTNALFGKLQAVTAQQIGVDPVVTVSANTSGGVCGKMISPQSIAVATGSTGLVGKEATIFRFTLKHSLILTACIAVMTYLQAYVIKWIVPVYTMTPVVPAATKAAPVVPDSTGGLMYLGITVAVVLLIAATSRVMGSNLQVIGRKAEVHFH